MSHDEENNMNNNDHFEDPNNEQPTDGDNRQESSPLIESGAKHKGSSPLIESGDGKSSSDDLRDAEDIWDEDEEKEREQRLSGKKRTNRSVRPKKKSFLHSPMAFFKSKDKGGRNLDTDLVQQKNANKMIILFLVGFLLVGLLVLIWQLYSGYYKNQNIDGSARVTGNVKTETPLISGEKVNKDYATRVAAAEEERQRDTKGSFVAQQVDLFDEAAPCKNCEARIISLEHNMEQTGESLDKLVTATQTLNDNQVKLNEDIGSMRDEMANIRVRAGAAPAQAQAEDPNKPPIPYANYYEDYKGREFMSNSALADEYVAISAIMNTAAARSAGGGGEFYASYAPTNSKASDDGGGSVYGGAYADKAYNDGKQLAALGADGANGKSSGKRGLLTPGYYDGQLEIGVNTDKGVSPIVATVTTGKWRGAKLFAENYIATREGVSIKFTSYYLPDGRSGPITAFAVDASSRTAGLASDVDNHYFSRTIGAMLTRGIEGWGAAYAAGGTTQIAGGTIVQERSKVTDKQAIRQGLGVGAGAVADIITDITNRPPTIKVEAQSYQIGIYVIN